MMNNERSFRNLNYRNESRRGRRYNQVRHPNNETWNSNQSYRNHNPNESRYYENYYEDNYNPQHYYNSYNNRRTNFQIDTVDPRNSECEQTSSSMQQNQRTNINNIINETSESKVPDNKPNIHIKFPNPRLEENEKNLNSSQAGTSSETNILNEDPETDIPKVKIEKTDIKVEQLFEVGCGDDSSTTCESVNNSPNIIDVCDSDEFFENYPDTVPTEISSNSNNVSQNQSVQDLRNTNTGTAIYISNLPRRISEADLKTFYERYGEIKSIRIIHNHDRSEKRCIVVFNNAEDAVKSIETNGLYYERRNLQVRLFSSRSKKHSIFVTKCPKKCTVQQFYNIFEPCGPVNRVMLRHPIALISFEMKASVELAILFNDFKIRGAPLKISKASLRNIQNMERNRYLSLIND